LNRVNLKALWDLWWLGFPADGVGPLRFLEPVDLVAQADKVLRAKAAYCMDYFLDASSQLGLGNVRRIKEMNTTDRDKVFEQVFIHICQQKLFQGHDVEELDRKRIGDLSFQSICEYISGRRTLHLHAIVHT
jgi:hypothetical protein